MDSLPPHQHPHPVPGDQPGQHQTVFGTLTGAAAPPLLWPAAVNAVWRRVPQAVSVLRRDELTVVVDGPGADAVMIREVIPVVVSASGGALVPRHGRVSTDPDSDTHLDVPSARVLDGLVAAELGAAQRHWQTLGAGRAAALHLAAPLSWLERAALHTSALFGEAARHGSFTSEDVHAWVSAHTPSADWWLMVPGLAEALIGGALTDAFEDGERIDVGLTSDALLGMGLAAAAHTAQIRGVGVGAILDGLLRTDRAS